MCGDGVRKISVRDGAFWEHGKPFDLSAFLKTIRTRWVFQPIVANHPTLQTLNPSSLNTVRMMTCWNRHTHQAELWGDSALRIGRKGELVDNLHAGGIVVGVSASGRLKPDGIAFWDNFSAARYSHHPDSGIRFGEGRSLSTKRRPKSSWRRNASSRKSPPSGGTSSSRRQAPSFWRATMTGTRASSKSPTTKA